MFQESVLLRISILTIRNAINDDIFEKIVAIPSYRSSLYRDHRIYRETQESRERVLKVGVSQISGASSTSVGDTAEKNQR